MLGKLFTRSVQFPPWGPSTSANPWGAWPGDTSYGTDGDALHLMTVLGCVRLISDSISTLPIDVFRRQGDEKIPVAKPMWLEEPMVGLDFASWCGQVLASLLLYGNAFILIGRNESGAIVRLQVLNPEMVSIVAGEYLVNGRPGAEVLHVKGLMLPGETMGLNPIAYARKTINLGLDALEYGSQFFKSGFGNMPGVIESPTTMEPTTKKDIALQWQRKRKVGGRGLPGILDGGATWKPTGVTNEDAQFLATRNYTAAEIAGQLFLVDPSDLGIAVNGTSLTYANLQDRNTRRVQVTLLPWIVRVETAISALLARPRYMKFNVDGLLRGSLKDQMDTWAVGVQNSILAPNEPRAWMDLPPLPGGDMALSDPMPAPTDRSINITTPPVTVLNEMPKSPDVHIAPAVVNVAPAEVRVEPAQINIAPAAVTIESPDVNVAPAVVNVTAEAIRQVRQTQQIERDADGRIVAIHTTKDEADS